MKTKNQDDDDPNQSLFAVASLHGHHPFSKTTRFADISEGVMRNGSVRGLAFFAVRQFTEQRRAR